MQHEARAVVIGPVGVGKSLLCTALCGLPEDNQTFLVGDAPDAVTTHMVQKTAHWLGRHGEGKGMVIDTPGSGTDQDAPRLAELVQNLADLKRVHVFLLVFNAEQPRCGVELRNLLQHFEESFGSSFWRHVICVFTHWYMDKKARKRRKKTQREVQWEWTEKLNAMFPQAVQEKQDKPFPSFFIDSAAVTGESSEGEAQAALEELERLVTYTQSQEAFETKRRDYQLIASPYASSVAVAELLRCKEVAVDIEGIELCRTGRVCLLQACGWHTPVFLFDVVQLGGIGNLRSLLEDSAITKVVFDGRADSDALFHLFNGTRMRNVYDVQVLFTFKFSNTTDRYLKGLHVAVENMTSIASAERTATTRLKDAGKLLFAREFGGRATVWEQRPLPDTLLQYAACDVKLLLPMKREWSSARFDRSVVDVSARRMDKAIAGSQPSKGSDKAKRDFDLHGFGVAFAPRPKSSPVNYRSHASFVSSDDDYSGDDYDPTDDRVSFWDVMSPEDYGFETIQEAEDAGF